LRLDAEAVDDRGDGEQFRVIAFKRRANPRMRLGDRLPT
jgi:hypothetical protein